MSPKKPTIQDFKRACEAKAGNVTNIAKAFNADRTSVYKWMKNPRYKQAYEDVRESLLDFNESQQLLLIRGVAEYEDDDDGNKKFVGWKEKPSETMIIWFDKTRGKHRGLTEKVEMEISEKADVPIKKWLEESRKQRAAKKKEKK